MNYYLVTTKCGHVGKQFYMPITFAIKAENGKEAAKIARQMPRVKHNHWDAILGCEQVDEVAYKKQKSINAKDPYLHVDSRHKQNEILNIIKERLVRDNHQNEKKLKKQNSSKPNLMYQKKKYEFDYRSYSTQLAEAY